MFRKFRDDFSDVLTHGLLALPLRVLGGGSSFLLIMLLTNILGSEGYGLYALSLTIVTILGVLTRFGADNAALRRVAVAWDQELYGVGKGYLVASAKLVALLSISVTLGIVLSSAYVAEHWFDKAALNSPLTIMSMALMPFSCMYLLIAGLRATREFAASTIIQTIAIPVTMLIVLGVGAYYIEWSVGGVAWVYVLALVLSTTFAFLRLPFSLLRSNTVSINVKNVAVDSLPLMLASSGGMVLLWTDTIVLGVFEPSEQVGIYNAASRTATLLGLILAAVNTVAAARFSVLHAAGDRKELGRYVNQVTWLMIGLSIPVLLFVLFFAEWILSFFGESFQSGALLLRILAIGQFGNVICGSVSMLLSMTGHAKALQRIVWATALMNIGLSIVLVQGMGALGVAIATAVSVFTWNIWALFIVRKRLGFWTFKSI